MKILSKEEIAARDRVYRLAHKEEEIVKKKEKIDKKEEEIVNYHGLEIKSDDADILTAMGTVYLKSEHPDEAENFFIKALEISENEVACNNLGIVYFQRKNYKKAKELYKKALAINPDYQEARENVALANFYIEMLCQLK